MPALRFMEFPKVVAVFWHLESSFRSKDIHKYQGLSYFNEGRRVIQAVLQKAVW